MASTAPTPPTPRGGAGALAVSAGATVPYVYMFAGHGELEADMPPVEIPKGVILINTAVCGTYSYDTSMVDQLRNDRLKEFYLNTPYPRTPDERLAYNQSLYKVSLGGFLPGEVVIYEAAFEGEIVPESKNAPYTIQGYTLASSGIRRLYVTDVEDANMAGRYKAVSLPPTPNALATSYKHSVYPSQEQVAGQDPKTYKMRNFNFRLSEVIDDMLTNEGRKFKIPPPTLDADGNVVKHVIIVDAGCKNFSEHKYTSSIPYSRAGSVSNTRKFGGVSLADGNSYTDANTIREVDSKTIPALITEVDENGNTRLMAYIQEGRYDAAHRLLVRITNEGASAPTRPVPSEILQYIALRNTMGQSAFDLALMANASPTRTVADVTAVARLLRALEPLSVPIGFMNPQNQPAKKNVNAKAFATVSRSSIDDLLSVSKYGVTYLMTLAINQQCDAIHEWLNRMERAVETGEIDTETLVEYVNKRSIHGIQYSVVHNLEQRCPLRRDILDRLIPMVTPTQMVSIYEPGVLVYSVGVGSPNELHPTPYRPPYTPVRGVAQLNNSRRRKKVREAGGNVNAEENQYTIEGTQIIRTSPRGEKTVVSGTGEKGFQDGPISSATFHTPVALCYNKGSLYVIDGRRIRVIEHDVVKTIAGGGAKGLQDGDGYQATFRTPTHIYVTSEGDITVTDEGATRIVRRISRNITSLLSILSNSATSDREFINCVGTLTESVIYGGSYTYDALAHLNGIPSLVSILRKNIASEPRCVNLMLALNWLINHPSNRNVGPRGLLAMGKPSDILSGFRNSRTIEDNINDALETDLVPTVLEAVRIHKNSPHVCADALYLLMWVTFVEKGKQYVKNEIGLLPLLDFLHKALRTYTRYDIINVSATTMLASLSEVSEMRAPISDGFFPLLLEVLDLTVKAEGYHITAMSVATLLSTATNCFVIFNNLSNDPAFTSDLFTDEFLYTVLTILNLNSKNGNICNQILLLLDKDVLTYDRMEFLVSPPSRRSSPAIPSYIGIMPLFKTIFETHGGNKEICEAACSLLARITSLSEAQLQSRTLVPLLGKCMKDHAASLLICRTASTVLQNISKTNKDWVREVIPQLAAIAARHEAQCPMASAVLESLGSNSRTVSGKRSRRANRRYSKTSKRSTRRCTF